MLPKLLKFKDLKAAGIVANWTTLDRWCASGHFPPGIKLGPNSRAWTEDEVEAWIASRPTAKNGGA